MLLSLLLVVLAAISCVLWFMREAMRNERLAVREKLAEAYSGQLSLVQTRTMERWNAARARLDSTESAEARFERCVKEGLAESVVCLDAEGAIGYPRVARASGAHATTAALDNAQVELREMVQAGKGREAVRFVAEKFASTDATVDAEGRVVAANAELLAIELMMGN
jgi:hypothetical protein